MISSTLRLQGPEHQQINPLAAQAVFLSQTAHHLRASLPAEHAAQNIFSVSAAFQSLKGQIVQEGADNNGQYNSPDRIFQAVVKIDRFVNKDTLFTQNARIGKTCK
jgi:hypothetical protein